MIVELAAGDLSVGIVDNDAHLDRDGHKAGYNGLARLEHTARRANLFVPTYAGLNLELYFDGVMGRNDGDRPTLFEPRSAPMSCVRIDDTCAELHQPPTPHWQVESVTTFRLRPPHYIDFQYRAIPRAKTFEQGWMGVFWASYIDHPEDLAISFPAATPSGPRWVRHYSAVHGRESTHRRDGDTFEVKASHAQEKYMYASFSPWRYARPYYYGVSHGMMYFLMLDDDPRLRFTQSPSGGGIGCPAWDYQFIVPEYKVGTGYEFRGRLMYAPFRGEHVCEREYERWMTERATA